MNQVLPYPLWLSHAIDKRDFRPVLEAGISAVVQVAAEEASLHLPRDLVYCHFPLLDGTGNRAELLFLSASTVATLLKLRVPTLVCGGAGMSRTPAIAAAALAMVLQEPPEDCLKRVVAHHASDVSPGLWSEVIHLLPSVR